MLEITESKTVSLDGGLILEEKDAGDWAYRGEGACNLVLAYTGYSPSFVNKKHLTISQILCTIIFLLQQALCMCLCVYVCVGGESDAGTEGAAGQVAGESKPVATPEILSKVFLFHFEKISSHFGLFRDISVNTG